MRQTDSERNCRRPVVRMRLQYADPRSGKSIIVEYQARRDSPNLPDGIRDLGTSFDEILRQIRGKRGRSDYQEAFNQELAAERYLRTSLGKAGPDGCHHITPVPVTVYLGEVTDGYGQRIQAVFGTA
ncbi:hypothetical protein [Cryobacterium zhongshanensis]|uniref:Uncharacterized protein n=1 Tax=Cryobacterium zhongshanensis TaxID=2928153 RepID=A0AA41UM77_9MICO|nr:hypothetical protein [Cryobacterium zhongshanensis]MCI4659571.1 hypothetical protein [Cryobacterium zhongshanensis]